MQKPLRIFHITAICNLERIAKSKKLLAKTELARKKIVYGNIAYQGAQGKRSAKIVTRPPGGVIHEYVPFYFAPRSPMLMAIDHGRVDGCDYRQPDIVHFATTVEAVVKNGLPYVFYDHNATLDFSVCYSDVKDLDKVDWPLFYEPPRLDGYCQFFFNNRNNPKYVKRKETRQAEFLIHKSVSLQLMDTVGVYDQAKADEVRTIFDEADLDLDIAVKTDWYF